MRTSRRSIGQAREPRTASQKISTALATMMLERVHMNVLTSLP
jgi:hypothetical protein